MEIMLIDFFFSYLKELSLKDQIKKKFKDSIVYYIQ